MENVTRRYNKVIQIIPDIFFGSLKMFFKHLKCKFALKMEFCLPRISQKPTYVTLWFTLSSLLGYVVTLCHYPILLHPKVFHVFLEWPLLTFVTGSTKFKLSLELTFYYCLEYFERSEMKNTPVLPESP